MRSVAVLLRSPRLVSAPDVAVWIGLALAVGSALAVRNVRAQSPARMGERVATPMRQSSLVVSSAAKVGISLRDASRQERWLGVSPREVRWSPDGATLYFRWHGRPRADDIPERDPWYRTDRDAMWAEEVPAGALEEIPGDTVVWNRRGSEAAWIRGSAIYLYRAGRTNAVRRLASFDSPPTRLRFAERDSALHFMLGESLQRLAVGSGALSVVAVRVTVDRPAPTAAARRLAEQQRELSSFVRERDRVRDARAALARAEPTRALSIPAAPGTQVDDIQLTPDGAQLTFRLRTPAKDRVPTRYVDYADASGYARVREARAKVGEPRDRWALGIIDVDAAVPAESVTVRWVALPVAGTQATVPHGPTWNPAGTRAVVQFAGEHAKDLWIAEVDARAATARVVVHEHDDAWLGGPSIQSNSAQPTLFEWLDDTTFAFATERSGWSHLARSTLGGAVVPLTSGAWEVRGAALSRDRTRWLLQTSQHDAAEDHLYGMPSGGGALTRVTMTGGRNSGVLSPDGARLAVLRSDNVSLADLYVQTLAGPRAGGERRVTASGTDEYQRRTLITPEIVSIPHPDGKPVWAALYRPRVPNAERAALIHVHGGGYRQFAHRGWSVYGWSGHVGLLHYFLEQGYTVLDFDYRGGAGFGRDYRTDVAGAMGTKDVDGAVAASAWLVREAGIDSSRIGIYGVSYGGFMTLMSLFRYPGRFAAGIARAPVTDWAHYSDAWTSRILGLPQVDSAAYRRSSPIYFADGLRDPLLIEHGLVDDNVHFQDTARLVQRLIELEKSFEVMYYPVEPHLVETEASRLDQSARAARFFDRYLRGKR